MGCGNLEGERGHLLLLVRWLPKRMGGVSDSWSQLYRHTRRASLQHTKASKVNAQSWLIQMQITVQLVSILWWDPACPQATKKVKLMLLWYSQTRLFGPALPAITTIMDFPNHAHNYYRLPHPFIQRGIRLGSRKFMWVHLSWFFKAIIDLHVKIVISNYCTNVVGLCSP